MSSKISDNCVLKYLLAVNVDIVLSPAINVLAIRLFLDILASTLRSLSKAPSLRGFLAEKGILLFTILSKLFIKITNGEVLDWPHTFWSVILVGLVLTPPNLIPVL